MNTISRPAPDEATGYFHRYIDLVGEDDVLAAMTDQAETFVRRLDPLDDEHGNHRYAEGKWSVKEVIGHLVDTERILGFRALAIARGEATPLPGFDEDRYAEEGRFDERTLADLLEELRRVRAATVALFRHLPGDALGRRGVANGHPITPRAIAHVILGHAIHHARVLDERYLPGLPG